MCPGKKGALVLCESMDNSVARGEQDCVRGENDAFNFVKCYVKEVFIR